MRGVGDDVITGKVERRSSRIDPYVRPSRCKRAYALIIAMGMTQSARDRTVEDVPLMREPGHLVALSRPRATT
jgi:hypothetical protein